MPNKLDAATPAMTFLFHAGHPWRWVAEPCRPWRVLRTKQRQVMRKMLSIT